jgi:hypothetical protein
MRGDVQGFFEAMGDKMKRLFRKMVRSGVWDAFLTTLTVTGITLAQVLCAWVCMSLMLAYPVVAFGCFVAFVFVAVVFIEWELER